MDISLDEFIKSGTFQGAIIDGKRSELDNYPHTKLTIGEENGDWFDYDINNCHVRIQSKDNIISCIIIRIDFFNQDKNFTFNGKDLKEIDLLKFLSLADKLKISWEFKSCSLKVLVGRFLNSKVEFIYDCNTYEESDLDEKPEYFFYSFQVSR